MTDLYMTVQGRSQDTTEAIVESDAKLGVAADNDWIEGYTPTFVDYPFTNPDVTYDEHLEVVRAVEPELTVAPDIEKGRAVDDVLRQADELAEYADNVIVVPKDCHPSVVPSRFRVGMPVADFGSGAPWTVWDYRGVGGIHILGGSPNSQLAIGRHLPVASVDTAVLGKRARFGAWDGKSVDTPDDAWGYKERLRWSLDNYAACWGCDG